MEKTYKILEDAEAISEEEIRRLYKGYWVYVVNAVFNENREFVSGIPVIIGSKPYDGSGDGIYNKYKSHDYDERTDFNLLLNKGFISSFRIASK
jgi:hypothetical protein